MQQSQSRRGSDSRNAELPAWKKASNTDRWTEILFRALSSRVADRWRFVSFRGAAGAEWRGIVDILAVRKDAAKSDHELLKAGDLFEFILIQMKGGSARAPNPAELDRLCAVADRYQAKAVVLFSWKKGASSSFRRLDRKTKQWAPSSSKVLFG